VCKILQAVISIIGSSEIGAPHWICWFAGKVVAVGGYCACELLRLLLAVAVAHLAAVG
jgi:hypothetical protein